MWVTSWTEVPACKRLTPQTTGINGKIKGMLTFLELEHAES